METMTLPTPTRSRWFGGLRRSPSRLVGGVASGLADFWWIDPVVLRVALASPLVTAVLAWMGLVVTEPILGDLAVPLTQLVWVMAGYVVTAYCLAWVAIPPEGGPSVARRLLDLRGPKAWLVWLVSPLAVLALLGWFGALFGAVQSVVGAFGTLFTLVGFLTAVGAVALFVGWLLRGGDLRDVVQRLGTPGLGRSEQPDGAAPQPSQHPAHWARADAEPSGDPTVVLPTDGPASSGDAGAGTSNPTVAFEPSNPEGASDPTVALNSAHQGLGGLDRIGLSPTTPLDSTPLDSTPLDSTPLDAPPPDATPPLAAAAPDPTPPIPDAVQRARAAAREAEREQAAAAEAQRQARTQEQRARRQAARALRRERNRWGWLVAALTLIAGGGLLLTDQLGMTDLGGLGIGVVCLALLTTGVLVGAWFGSGRWLILPALLLSATLATGAYAATAVDHAADAAPVLYAPGSLPAGEHTYLEWGTGAVTVDLTETEELDARSLAVEVDRGSLTVIVPADQWVSVSSEVVAGTNQLAPPRWTIGDVPLGSSGYQDLNPGDRSGGAGGQPLYLSLNVGIGDLAVIQKES